MHNCTMYSVIDKAVIEITIIDALNCCKTLNVYENISKYNLDFYTAYYTHKII